MDTVLITGFEPFGGEETNPSAQAALALHGRVIAGHRLEARVLPCAFGAAPRVLKKALAELSPRLVVGTGQAGGRAALGLERVAVNLDDARIPDNLGKQPIDRPVVRGGPVGYLSSLPLKAILRSLGRAGIAAEISGTAGSFVCNHTFYALMHVLAGQRRTRGGFVHLPYSPEQARAHGAPSLSLDDAVKALELIVKTSLKTKTDLRAKGGSLH